MSDNLREPILTKDGVRIASRPETVARKWQARASAAWKTIVKRYKEIIPPYHRRKVRYGALLTLTGAIVSVQAFFHNPAPLTVYFYDIGQGDGFHIRTAAGFDVLVDGGPHDTIVEKLGRTLPFWDRTIELMIATHADADHITGQIAVLRRFEVKRVLSTGVVHTTDEYLEWLSTIKEKGVPVEIVKTGGRYELASPPANGPADTRALVPYLQVLWPDKDWSGKRPQEIEGDLNMNDTSIVARLTFGEVSFLFTGDAEEGVEEQLVQKYDANMRMLCQSTNTNSQFADLHEICRLTSQLSADVLKVGHHGSKTSSSKEFLRAVSPKYAVIQSGRKNRFGHPHFAVLWRLKQVGAQVLRNDQDGGIIFETDGTTLQYRVKGVR